MKEVPLEYALILIEIIPKRLGFSDEQMFALTKEAKDDIKYLLDIPNASFGGKPLYETVSEAAATLFYSVIKDHKFENGNKRTAVILTLAFLHANGRWPMIQPDEMYDLALGIAKSKPEKREEEITRLTDLFNKKVVRVSLILRWVDRLFGKK